MTTPEPTYVWPTRRDIAFAMLRRPQGATIAQIADQLDCSANAARLQISALRKAGNKIDVLDRVICVGPNRTGAKGSYPTFRAAAWAAQ